MNLFVNVLIAAVTVNCLVMLINGKAANDTLAVPYIDMLLPPLKDVQDNNKNAAPKINGTAKATDVHTIITTKSVSGTTKNTISKNENNILPELSLEVLLPPLYEAKTEKAETRTSPTTIRTTSTTTTTTTQRPTTKTTTTTKPLKVTNKKLPDLVLEPLLPPLRLANNIENVKDEKTTTTTKKPITTTSTTRKSYHLQQQTQDRSEVNKKSYGKQQQQLSHVQASTAGNEIKNYNKPAASTIIDSDKHVAESQTHTKQVSLASQQQNTKLQSKVETVTQQYVAKQKPNNSNYTDKQLNYSFALYLGSTTPRPTKYGLPTITPFPHRLGR